MRTLLGIFFVGLFFISCKNVGNPLVTDYKPKAISKSNDIVVVADEAIWDGMVGDTFRYYFESAYPITPSPEPIFNLRFFTPRQLTAEPLRKQLRTYCVLADIQDTLSETTKMLKMDYGPARFSQIMRNDSMQTGVGKNKWATDQLVIYVYGRGEDQLIDAVKDNFNNIANKIHEHDAPQIKANTYVSGRHLGLTEKIKQHFQVKFDVPGDYKEALYVPGKYPMIWLRKDTRRAALNIAVQKLPYDDIKQITVDNAIRLTNNFGLNVTSDTPGSHMVVNEEDLPILENVKEINGNYTLEVRGIWEMEKDFMGGPFVAYLIPDADKSSYIFILNFVYAPGMEKKIFLQELETVVNTFDIF